MKTVDWSQMSAEEIVIAMDELPRVWGAWMEGIRKIGEKEYRYFFREEVVFCSAGNCDEPEDEEGSRVMHGGVVECTEYGDGWSADTEHGDVDIFIDFNGSAEAATKRVDEWLLACGDKLLTEE